MGNNTHLNEHLTKCFVSYFCSLKEDANALSFTQINMAFYSALGGLDKECNCADFVHKTKEDFELIAKHLDKIAQEMYKEERSKEGIGDSRPRVEATYSVADVARRLGISEQAVRKNINTGKLAAKMDNRHRYEITKRDLDAFIHSKKKNVSNRNP